MSDQSELALLDGAEFKIALAETSSQLAQVLGLYLAPILLKLQSQYESVREKAQQISDHVEKRVSTEKITLPFAALLSQAKDPNLQNNVRLESLKFCEIAASFDEAVALCDFIPQLCHNFDSLSSEIAEHTFQLLVRLLCLQRRDGLKQISKDIRFQCGFENNKESAAAISDRFLNLMLYQPTAYRANGHTNGFENPLVGTFVAAHSNNNPESGTSVFSENISQEDAAFVAPRKDNTYLGSKLADAKVAVLRFILSEAFTNDERWTICFVAALDSSSEIRSIAEPAMRKFVKIESESPAVYRRLFQFCVPETDTSIPADRRRPSAKDSIAIQAIALLSKSKSFIGEDRYAERLVEYYLNHPVNLKLKQAVANFIQHIAQNSALKPERCEAISLNLIRAVDNGLPNSESLKDAIYSSIGVLAKRASNTNLDLLIPLKCLFQTMEHETGSLRLSCQESLSRLLPETEKLKEESKENLINFLENLMKSNLIHLYPICLRFIAYTRPFSDCKTRLMTIDLARRSSGQFQDEAKKLLDPFYFYFSMQKTSQSEYLYRPLDAYPKFVDLIEACSMYGSDIQSIWATFGRHGAETFIQFAFDCLMCNLLQHLDLGLRLNESFTSRVHTILETDIKTRKLIREKLTNDLSDDVALDDAFLKLISTIQVGLTRESFTTLSVASQLMEFVPNINRYLSHFSEETIKSMLMKGNNESQISCARFYSLYLFSQMGESSIDEKLGSLIKCCVDTKIIKERFGITLATSFFVSLVLSSGYTISRSHSQELLRLLEELMEENIILQEAALLSFAELGVFGVLSTLSQGTNFDQAKILYSCKASSKSAERTIHLSSIVALSNISLDQKFQDLSNKEICDILIGMESSKSQDTLLAVGEALAVLSCGWESEILKRRSIPKGVNLPEVNSEKIIPILKSVMELCRSPRRSQRKAGSLWLLSLVQYCKSSPVIIASLTEIYKTFMSFLADPDDFQQETASRGLNLVYNASTKETKEALTAGLLKTFSSNRLTTETKMEITSESELFQENALKTNDGSISTYKDICSLASETGKPEMIYQFLNLANSSMLWQSRKGAALGLASMNSETIKLKDLESILPRLFRYRFDPSPSVASSMGSIWKALIPNSKEVATTYFDLILQESLTGLGDRQWRTRESSCKALADLLAGQKLEIIEKDFETVWNMAFRALDDIKESVRNSGLQLCQQLSKIVVHSITSSDTTAADKQRILDITVPFLLRNLSAEAADVQKFATQALIDIFKARKMLLQPYFPELLKGFIELLSSTEPAVLNYVSSFHATSLNLNQEELDLTRVSSMKSSNLYKSIEDIVAFGDEETMSRVIEALIESSKESVGFLSKIACSSLFTLLVIKNPRGLNKYADRCMEVIKKQIQDYHSLVRKSYIDALGYMVREASDETVSKCLDGIIRDYFVDDDAQRVLVADTFKSLCGNSKGRIRSSASKFMSLVAIAMHDTSDHVRRVFTSIWAEESKGSETYREHADKIISSIMTNLSSQSWTLRVVCAKTLIDLNDVINLDTTLDNLLAQLKPLLVGKSFKGKEHILRAYILIIVRHEERLKDHKYIDECNSIQIKEVQSKNIDYRRHALNIMTEYLSMLEEVDILKDVLFVSCSFFDADMQKLVRETSDERNEQGLKTILIHSYYNLISQALANSARQHPEKTDQSYSESFKILSQGIESAPWVDKNKFSAAISLVSLKLTGTRCQLSTENIQRTWSIVRVLASDKGYESVRRNAITALRHFLQWIKQMKNADSGLREEIKTGLRDLSEAESSEVLKTQLRAIRM